MSDIRALGRISFLANNFNILLFDELEEIKAKFNDIDLKFMFGSEAITILKGDKDIPLAIYQKEMVNNQVVNVNIRIYEDVFSDMVQYDPTPNKSYVQWMLTTMTRFIKNNELKEAIRFATEDLNQANEYLALFHRYKVTNMFKELCKKNYSVSKIEDPRNINQYRNLSQVFDAVDPYIIRDVSELEREMLRYVKLDQAEIPFRDRNYTLYIPLTIAASVIFDKFVGWCTAKKANSNFETYTKQKTSLGENSKLYIIINNNFFLESDNPNYSDEIYQIHFESHQIMNKQDKPENDLKTKIFDKSDGLSNYFLGLLTKLARGHNGALSSNMYLTRLIKFGYVDIIFDIISPEIPTINFIDISLPNLPSLNHFQLMKSLYLNNCQLKELDNNNIKDLHNLAILSLPNNKLTSLPECIGDLKELVCINVTGNKIKKIPSSFGKLDKSNGGKLARLVIMDNSLSSEELERIKVLLPTTKIIASQLEVVESK